MQYFLPVKFYQKICIFVKKLLCKRIQNTTVRTRFQEERKMFKTLFYILVAEIIATI